MKVKKLFKKLLQTFDWHDRSCTVCRAIQREHTVEHVFSGWDSSGFSSPMNYLADEEGNVWVVSYNRRCLTCGHVWYLPGQPGATRKWDEAHMHGPHLQSCKGEIKRIKKYIVEHGSISIGEFARIGLEERERAGFVNTAHGWKRKSDLEIPPSL